MDDPRGRFRDLTLDQFGALLSSDTPAPGGGTASAVAASLAADLVAMVAALSENRPKYAPYAEVVARHGADARQLAGDLLDLADEDARVYEAFARAMKLPRETDAEKAARSAAIQLAARDAAAVPLRTLEACRSIVVASEALAGRSNLSAASDLAVASRLAEAGAHGAADNVLVNLPAMADPAAAEAMTARVAEILGDVADLAESTRAHVELGALREP
ncbi:MAG: cyclodeaminase/cyclohydrolase family protein [Chloroflexi bacterium]|jgi:formiminotetrahydrofolate cyclodeaminase|nr:cyclodeaminase/cyclohydrolase family protein [Chloroflexota bacterium]